MTYDPLTALLTFVILSLLGYFLFRPDKGWYWVIRRNIRYDERVITEDILKQLYRLESVNAEASIHTLTQALKVNDRAIIEVLHQMHINDLVSLDGDLIRLNTAGKEYALRIIRVHRLYEKYLAERTGYDKREWHDRAERKEHELSHEETNLLAEELGNPMFDPHGDPIPGPLGRMKSLKGMALSQLKEGEWCRIVHIEDEPEVIYQQILAQHIHIGSMARIIENNPERVLFHAEGESFALAPVVAANITVNRVEMEDEVTDGLVRLSSLQQGEKGVIEGISKECRGESRRRLLDLGFVRGAEIGIELESPLQNPVAYAIKGTSIALRKDQATKILIKKL